MTSRFSTPESAHIHLTRTATTARPTISLGLEMLTARDMIRILGEAGRALRVRGAHPGRLSPRPPPTVTSTREPKFSQLKHLIYTKPSIAPTPTDWRT
ncbi:hypothetical protein [Nonomuraea sp. MG754425]|uniref:hypothetical protein n=1 Tax=Nonomuraea sp. MG754425 TaxID=2570319 RepID=UPI001F34312C|nr:hypothetical protein [Nonomuraea sp. MG754425]